MNRRQLSIFYNRVNFRPYGIFVVLIMVAAIGLGAGCKQTLVHNLNEEEINDALLILEANEIVAQKQRGEKKEAEFDLLVMPEQRAEAWSLLKSFGIPKTTDNGDSLGKGSDSLVKSPTEEHLVQEAQTSEKIRASIQPLGGIQRVNVIVSLPRRKAPTLIESQGNLEFPRASVIVTHAANVEPPSRMTIGNLVKGSIHDITEENIFVEYVSLPTWDEQLQQMPQGDLARGIVRILGLTFSIRVAGLTLITFITVVSLLIFVLKGSGGSPKGIRGRVASLRRFIPFLSKNTRS